MEPVHTKTHSKQYYEPPKPHTIRYISRTCQITFILTASNTMSLKQHNELIDKSGPIYWNKFHMS